MTAVPRSDDRVLSTLNSDGSRRWLKPKLARGRYWRRRRLVAWGLIALFVTLPHLRINGLPPVLLDIPAREFTLFGKTFLPTDTLLLALLLIGIFLAVFLATALLGRVWCGWACPQTVYLEFVFRPLERFFDTLGAKGKGRDAKPAAYAKPLKYLVYLVLSFALANTFLAYFVGTDALRAWVFESPHHHPFAFGLVLLVTGLMLFDFGFFREQMCIVACPYGRFQSVMLDRNSLIVGYDRARGEPRGRPRRNRARRGAAAPTAKEVLAGGGSASLRQLGVATALDEPAEPAQGDCIDCERCVAVCPTGIDIRDGLQMECIGCTQCIDACDDVMAKMGRPTGLIRYTSQEALETGRGRLLRPRVVLYPALLAIVGALFVGVLATKSSTDVLLLRGPGIPFNTLPTGEIANQARLRITNRSDEPAEYTLEAVGVEGVRLVADRNPIRVGPGEQLSDRVLLVFDPAILADGERVIEVRISDGQNFDRSVKYKLLGPGRIDAAFGGPASASARTVPARPSSSNGAAE